MDTVFHQNEGVNQEKKRENSRTRNPTKEGWVTYQSRKPVGSRGAVFKKINRLPDTFELLRENQLFCQSIGVALRTGINQNMR